MENLKMQALMELFAAGETDVEVVESSDGYGLTISNRPGEYIVLNEREREEQARDTVADSVWAFRSSFLSSMTGIPQVVFDKLAELCEDANDAVRAIVDATCGIDRLSFHAILSDGYGHFLSPYDGNEEEVQLDGEWFYVYRTN